MSNETAPLIEYFKGYNLERYKSRTSIESGFCIINRRVLNEAPKHGLFSSDRQ